MTQEIKDLVTKRVFGIADEVDWVHLTIHQRKQYYESWTSDPRIGGLLSQVMEENRVRVYLKDTVMRNYMRSRRISIHQLLNSMSMSFYEITEEFIKPQAILCDNTALYSLAAAREWKIALMSAFERGCIIPELEHNIVFFTEHTTGHFVDGDYRNMIAAAASRLGVRIHWVT